MARMSKEERAELEARLAADDDGDDDDEVSLTFADGSGFKGSMRRARSVAAARGYKLDPDPPADDDKKPAGEVKRFNAGRRTG